MREIKQAAVRQEEILQKAAELFREKGFIHTTTGDLIGALGISRGLLYYHFRDLEDVAERLVAGWAEETLKLAEQLPFSRELDAREKVAKLAETVGRLPENEDVYLLDRLRGQLMPALRKALLPILREGNYEGRFRIEDDEAAAEFLAAGLLYGGGTAPEGRGLIRRLLGY